MRAHTPRYSRQLHGQLSLVRTLAASWRSWRVPPCADTFSFASVDPTAPTVLRLWLLTSSEDLSLTSRSTRCVCRTSTSLTDRSRSLSLDRSSKSPGTSRCSDPTIISTTRSSGRPRTTPTLSPSSVSSDRGLLCNCLTFLLQHRRLQRQEPAHPDREHRLLRGSMPSESAGAQLQADRSEYRVATTSSLVSLLLSPLCLLTQPDTGRSRSEHGLPRPALPQRLQPWLPRSQRR